MSMEDIHMSDDFKSKVVIAEEPVFSTFNGHPLAQVSNQGGLQVPLNNDNDSIMSGGDGNQSDSPDFDSPFNQRMSEDELNSETGSENEEEENNVVKWSPSSSPQIFLAGEGLASDEDDEGEDDEDDEEEDDDEDDDEDSDSDSDDDLQHLGNVDMQTILSALDGIFVKKMKIIAIPSGDANGDNQESDDLEEDDLQNFEIKCVTMELPNSE